MKKPTASVLPGFVFCATGGAHVNKPRFMDATGRRKSVLAEPAKTGGFSIGFAPLIDPFVLPLNEVSAQ